MAVDRVFERKRAWLMIDLRHHMYSVDAMNRCDGNPQVFYPLFFFCILKIKLNPWQLFQCLYELEFLR